MYAPWDWLKRFRDFFGSDHVKPPRTRAKRHEDKSRNRDEGTAEGSDGHARCRNHRAPALGGPVGSRDTEIEGWSPAPILTIKEGDYPGGVRCQCGAVLDVGDAYSLKLEGVGKLPIVFVVCPTCGGQA